ncbi:thioredoxin domain-containing protein [Nocardia sp. NPDC050713]|uniref:DsbA family protein n=1 Tax=Nocardia sp. NPDC050713 TaxID=3154511 RepID=UPI0033DE87ED
MNQSRSNYTPRPMSSATSYALGGVALALIVLIVFLAFRSGRDEPDVRNDGYGPVRDPGVQAVLQPDGVVVLGKPGTPKTIDVFEDPLCPACGALERVYGQELAQQLDEGKLAVRYHYVNFLDPKSSSEDYSTRAIAANECVAEAGNGPSYAKFHELLFASKQPKEGGDDLSNEQLSGLAREAGAPEPIVQCVASGAKVADAKVHAKAATDDLTARLDGPAATPSVFDGSNKVDVNNEEWVVELTR